MQQPSNSAVLGTPPRGEPARVSTGVTLPWGKTFSEKVVPGAGKPGSGTTKTASVLRDRCNPAGLNSPRKLRAGQQVNAGCLHGGG